MGGAMSVLRRWRLPVRRVARRPRTVGRRAEDRRRAVHNHRLLRLALGAVVLYAVVLSVSYVSERVQAHNDHAALERSERAVALARSALARDAAAFSSATQANATAASTLARLQASAYRECRRVQELRDDANRNSRILHDVLQTSAFQLRNTSPVTRKNVIVAGTYFGFALGERYEPPTDCRAATSNPLSYYRPPSRPFPRVR